MAENENKCGHSGCRCSVNGDTKYCSRHCEDAEGSDITEISCECGHSGCGLV